MKPTYETILIIQAKFLNTIIRMKYNSQFPAFTIHLYNIEFLNQECENDKVNEQVLQIQQLTNFKH